MLYQNVIFFLLYVIQFILLSKSFILRGNIYDKKIDSNNYDGKVNIKMESTNGIQHNNQCLQIVYILRQKYFIGNSNINTTILCGDHYNECKRLISMENLIVSAMKNSMSDKEICNTFGLSDAERLNDNNKEIECKICQFSAEFIIQTIKNDFNTSENVLNAGIDTICDVLNVDDNICIKMKYIIQYTKLSILRGLKPLSPSNVCMEYKLCTSSFHDIKSIKVSENLKEHPKLDTFLSYKKSTLKPLLTEMSKLNNGTQPEQCNLCKQVITLIERAIKKDEETFNMICESIEIMCSYMPDTSRCHILVNKLDEIEKWIREGTIPLHVCEMLEFCDINKEHESNCQKSCYKIANTLLTLLNDDDVSYTDIENLKELSGTILNNGILNLNGLINMVDMLAVEDMSPNDICKPDGKICHMESNGIKSLSTNIKNPVSCVFCEYVTSAIQDAVVYNRYAIPIIQNGIDTLCKYLPNVFECNEISINFDKIIKLIQKGETPQNVCKDVNICTSNNTSQISDNNILSFYTRFIVPSWNLTYGMNGDDILGLNNIISTIKQSEIVKTHN